jgi:heme/copper-type cytochrome/quinol oxidase subunit 3
LAGSKSVGDVAESVLWKTKLYSSPEVMATYWHFVDIMIYTRWYFLL